MSIKAMTTVWEKSNAKGSVLLLLLAIADYAHDDGTNAYPSVDTLSNKIRMTESNTHVLIRKAQELGELKVERNASRFNTNLYSLLCMGTNFGGYKLERKRVQTGTQKGTSGCTQSVSNTSVPVISPDGENIEFPKPDPRIKRDAVLAKKEIQEAIVSFREGEAKKSDPRAADRAYKEVASKIFSNILGREGLVIGTDEQAARRARERGIPEQFIRDREAIYCGDAYDGAFRDTNKKPTAYWIVNELEKDFAVSKLEVEKNVKRNTKSAAREQYERELEAAGISPQSVHV
jgi:hypothetical protein